MQVPVEEMEWQRLDWLDDHTVSFIRNTGGTSNIWSYDLNTKALKQLTNFDGEQIFAYAWSPDRKQVACQRGTKFTNVTIISSER
jgi:tricorn protease-like protein